MKHLLLAFLDRGPAYGLELKDHHDALLGAVSGPVNVGQIYTTLGRLEAQDMVSHRAEQSEVGPDRKVYELTETGTKEVERWLESPSAAPELRSEAVSKIVLALGRGRNVQPLIAAHRQSCLEGLKALDLALEAQEGTASGAGERSAADELARNALIQAGALRLQAELRWLDHVERQAAQ